MSTDVETFLAHYGKKGMRWGVVNENKAPKGPSGHRIRIEAGYRAKGLTPEQATAATNKRIKAEKIIAVAGGVAVAGLAAYGAKVAIGKRFTDVVLDSNTDLHYINAIGSEKMDLDRRLYTTFEKADTDKYRGLLAETRRKSSLLFGEDPERAVIYDTVLRPTGTIRAPSHMQAKALYKQFAKADGQSRVSNYIEFNKNIVNDTPESKRFMEFAKSKGYNALLDANDQFVSGYNTKKPLIVFNAASSMVHKGETVVSKELAKSLYKKQIAVIYTKQLLPLVGLGAAAIAGKKSLDTHDKHQVINGYIKKNPSDTRDYADLYNGITISKRTGEYIIK